MLGASRHAQWLAFIALMATLPGAGAQSSFPPESVPANFNADADFAAHIRLQLLPQTEAASGRYAIGQQVMDRLLQQVPAGTAKFSWNVRIAPGVGNIFSSPDGMILIDDDLAKVMGSRAGLWAAALSHEIAHVIHRDWARRYLFEKSLREGGVGLVYLGENGGGSWLDARASAMQLTVFSQTLEFEADAESLMLMARAGFHPDFAPALHQLMHAQPGQWDGSIVDTSHPRWEDRDERLQKLYVAAGKEYDRLWPARYASPGGEPPVVVYAGSPGARRNSSGDLELLVRLHCQNLSGAVEVILRVTADWELRQLTGCTSNLTLIIFTLPAGELPRKHPRTQSEISVVDDRGALLTRALATPR